MARRAHIAPLGLAAAIACGGRRAAVPATPPPPPATVSERLLAMLPQGAQVVVELDLARLRGNPVVGEIVTRVLAGSTGEPTGGPPEGGTLDAGWFRSLRRGGPEPIDPDSVPASAPASPLAAADQLVFAAYGVGTAQAATLTVLAAPHEVAGATRLSDGFYAVGPPEWVEQLEQRVALAGTGESAFAIRAAPELLALRGHAMPAGAPGASLRITARLPFDARIALARQTGLEAAPAQLSAWGDVADDLALVVDCDAADPGGAVPGEASRGLAAALRGALAGLAEQPILRRLGLSPSLAGARLIARGTWVRVIIAVGPAHLRRVIERAAGLLGEPGATAPHPPVTPGDPPS